MQQNQHHKKTALEKVVFGQEVFFKIAHNNLLRPFFMSIVSDSNHWMFVSSNGGISAGRKNADYSFFPYYTDDKITESAEITGSKSLFWVTNQAGQHLWEPFSDRFSWKHKTQRNLYKNVLGNKIIFEEINEDLGLTFRYQWCSSNRFGFVKQSTLINNLGQPITVNCLDGFQNILPYGVSADVQNRTSNLVDAYKRSELIKDSGLGIFALSAIIVDKAEPSEALKANIAWGIGLKNPKYLLSSTQLETFRNTKSISTETDVKAEKGAYFVNAEFEIAPNSQKNWMLVANVNLNHSGIIAISKKIKESNDLEKQILDDIETGSENLLKLCAASDALQLSADHLKDSRHFSNTLFNIMRGGIFDQGYTIEKWDFENYLKKANNPLFASVETPLKQLPKQFSVFQLKNWAEEAHNPDLKRLCAEYLPLKFSRRHGDPSRPWNRFSINTQSELDGSKILDYEGNWRDIFQNWEALAHSYPEFVEGMVFKFLNASTFDGYNPYRVTKDGFDWETIEPHDPWSYIGYWGDHQIIYLLKFLEFIEKHEPRKLESLFLNELFVYANVPYKIKSYAEILKNPKDTISFDEKLDHNIRSLRIQLGADGALLLGKDQSVYKVNFIEKVLATVLAKMSNFIPEGGIWMNTQRPEWNDANNALVGNGVSMVTLYYLRRFLNFFKGVFETAQSNEIPLSEELALFFQRVSEALKNNKNLLSASFGNKARKQFLDALGTAGSEYRFQIYANGFSGKKKKAKLNELIEFTKTSLEFLEHSIRANKRKDGMYHAYNLMTVKNNSEVSISYLSEMLEGQVAVLSSGYLSSEEALEVLNGLKSSALFRDDQYSYLLYPNTALPGFMQKNSIPEASVLKSKLLSKLVAEGNLNIIEKDEKGNYHFNGNFKNASDVSVALETLSELPGYEKIASEEKKQVLEIFEEVFNHKAFTGRSGTFFGYEGLGSIYWHMVSKLLLAVQECCLKAIHENAEASTVGKLLGHYYEINEGIGVHKSPGLYGAFPTDPYSHTPQNKGAQQPGMTGQVKEDILSRFGELGVFVENGKLVFNPCMLRKDEFLTENKTFGYWSADGIQKQLELRPGSLGFTYCQVPVVYKIADADGVEVVFNDGKTKASHTLKMDAETSSYVFKRTGQIAKIMVNLHPKQLK